MQLLRKSAFQTISASLLHTTISCLINTKSSLVSRTSQPYSPCFSAPQISAYCNSHHGQHQERSCFECLLQGVQAVLGSCFRRRYIRHWHGHFEAIRKERPCSKSLYYRSVKERSAASPRRSDRFKSSRHFHLFGNGDQLDQKCGRDLRANQGQGVEAGSLVHVSRISVF